MPAPKLFVADERGLGGRQLLQQQFIHMLRNIKTANACLETGLKREELLRNRMHAQSLNRLSHLRRTPYHEKVPQARPAAAGQPGQRVDNALPQNFHALWCLPINQGLRDRYRHPRRRFASHAAHSARASPEAAFVKSATPYPLSPSECADLREQRRQQRSGGKAQTGISLEYDENDVSYYNLQDKNVRTGATECVRLARERTVGIALRHRELRTRRRLRQQYGAEHEDYETNRWQLSPGVREAVSNALASMVSDADASSAQAYTPHPPSRDKSAQPSPAEASVSRAAETYTATPSPCSPGQEGDRQEIADCSGSPTLHVREPSPEP